MALYLESGIAWYVCVCFIVFEHVISPPFFIGKAHKRENYPAVRGWQLQRI